IDIEHCRDDAVRLEHAIAGSWLNRSIGGATTKKELTAILEQSAETVVGVELLLRAQIELAAPALGHFKRQEAEESVERLGPVIQRAKRGGLKLIHGRALVLQGMARFALDSPLSRQTLQLGFELARSNCDVLNEAIAREYLARIAIRGKEPGGFMEAGAHLEEAYTVFFRLGDQIARDRVERLLRECGASPSKIDELTSRISLPPP
ncbi:MAG TPA: hypothetical protein VM285_09395, partial [Polyangia bacterium]|nr:hypothetical protein [Polyangia bacterium]